MLNKMSPDVLQAARRRVQAGLWMFFCGAAFLLGGLLTHVADPASANPLAGRVPVPPSWLVPDSAAGYTAALLLVCWGVWALGSGLRLAREDSSR
jgi:hypothetical protein